MRKNSFHVPKFLFQGIKHLFRDLELHSSRMMLDSQGVLAQVLDKHLILELIVGLPHLQHHILIGLHFLRFTSIRISICWIFFVWVLRTLYRFHALLAVHDVVSPFLRTFELIRVHIIWILPLRLIMIWPMLK